MSPFGNRTDDPDDVTDLTVEGVKSAMRQLPEGSRMIFSLYLLEGYDHREIAQILNVSESNSKSQYMRARRRIKEILKGGSDEKR
jgi:RNA polymerase sigma-70 factor (ECF subfamily)